MCRFTYYHDVVGSIFTGYVVKSKIVSVKLLLLQRSATIRGQRPCETLRVNNLCQAAQPLDEARTRLLRDVHVDAVHLARFDSLDVAPVGTLVDKRGIAAE